MYVQMLVCKRRTYLSLGLGPLLNLNYHHHHHHPHLKIDDHLEPRERQSSKYVCVQEMCLPLTESSASPGPELTPLVEALTPED